MEGDTKKRIDAMVTFCRVGDAAALSRFELIEKIFQVEFHQPEFDILRKEIGRCYVIDAHQGCITLTNHLVERYCKMLLIYVESNFKKITDWQPWRKNLSNQTQNIWMLI